MQPASVSRGGCSLLLIERLGVLAAVCGDFQVYFPSRCQLSTTGSWSARSAGRKTSHWKFNVATARKVLAMPKLGGWQNHCAAGYSIPRRSSCKASARQWRIIAVLRPEALSARGGSSGKFSDPDRDHKSL